MDIRQKVLALLMETTLFPDDVKANLLSSLPTMEEQMLERLATLLEDYQIKRNEIEAEYAQSLRELSKSYMKKLQDFSHNVKNDLLRSAERLYEQANEEEKELLMTQI